MYGMEQRMKDASYREARLRTHRRPKAAREMYRRRGHVGEGPPTGDAAVPELEPVAMRLDRQPG